MCGKAKKKKDQGIGSEIATGTTIKSELNQFIILDTSGVTYLLPNQVWDSMSRGISLFAYE